MSAPPPPPPHGETPRSGGLPPGKYDIFVIPEHSAGSGFLYLPSLQPNVNSFAAGFASALILVAVFQSMAPAFRAWWESFNGLGNMGITLLLAGVGFGAWALGRTQTDGSPNAGPKANGSHPGGGPGGWGSQTGATPNGTPPPQPGAAPNGSQKPQSSWQRPPPQTGAGGTKRPEAAKGAWEKARDEMRKKEEERKAKEADQKRREELAKRLAELRAKEAKERADREKEKERKDKEAAAKKATDAKTAEEKARAARVGSSYAYSGVGEKMNMWPNGRPPPPNSPATPKGPPSPGKRPPAPTARTYISTDEEAYSYRPYDQPRRHQRRPSGGSMHSDASWAPSHTTARTSPPPSVRGPYTTKDPDKIVIQAVYLFMNQYSKTPASQLISGAGSVTDGLILRITTEGLFIDDDVRGVPQREWDVKAWTLKLVEVWCPPHCLLSASASNQHSHSNNNKSANLLYKMATGRARHADKDASKPATGEEADAYLADMLKACKDCCRLGHCDQKLSNTNIPTSAGQTGEWKAKGLHVLRATVRDQDGKRYLFVIDETENWKVGAGLQRLRKGTQVRQLGLCSMTPSEARGALDTLGWAG